MHPYRQLKYYHEREDQKQRDNITLDAKEKYQRNYLSKEFNNCNPSQIEEVCIDQEIKNKSFLKRNQPT